MRLCTFRLNDAPDARPRAGVITSGGRVREVLGQADPSGDPVKALLTAGRPFDRLELADIARDLSDVTLLPPITRPDKFICVGLNYASHAREANMEVPEVPTFFVKLPNALAGPGEPIIIPRVSHRIDWEGELAVVIGRTAKDVTAADAINHVAGYTVTNDVTARDYQFKTSQWNLGKTFDGFAPTGPWLTTIDEIDDPHDLHLVTRLNGEIVQDARTSDLIFSIPDLVAFFSTVMTLVPGDVIATGTPAGIGALMKPRRWLRDKDIVSIAVEQVGELTNPVRGPA
ncbi:fumarylacetoacetate hydrolase family protein [Micromonospora sp. NPDC005113]